MAYAITIYIYSTISGNLTGVDSKATWLDALTLAYAVVLDNPGKVAHVFPTDSTSGLYIARHDDPQRKGWTDLPTMAEIAARKAAAYLAEEERYRRETVYNPASDL